MSSVTKGLGTKDEDKTRPFGCGGVHQPLPATVISPEHELMVSLAVFCWGALKFIFYFLSHSFETFSV